MVQPFNHRPFATSPRPLAMAVSLTAVLWAAPDIGPRFELVQPDLFGVTGGQPNAWADFDNDGDLDELVGFRGRPNRLYRQDHGRFEDVAAAVGLADNVETRAAAWGDFDADGNIDLYVGFVDGTRTSCIAMTATAAISLRSRLRSASTSAALRDRCRGSTTTTTAIS